MKNLLSQAERSRIEYNPLRGLTIARAVSLLEAGERGEYADLMWTYDFVERTDADLLALVERRVSAIVGMDWNIKTVSEETRGYSKAAAEAQATYLRECYESIGNLYEAVEHLEMAVFRGFSICQARMEGGLPVHLECLDPWNFAKDGRYGDWYWNPQARAVSARSLPEANRLKPRDIILHTHKRPIDHIGLIKFVRANLSEKDWDYFVECYGIPGVFVIMPDNVPEAQRDEYLAAAEAAARGNSGALPAGSRVESTKDITGTPPFEARLKYLSEQLVLAGTGGKLTMLTAAGSGTLAGNAHADTFEQIARASAAKISETLQKQLDARLLAARFPGQPRLAYFDLAAEESQDVGEIIADIKGLAEAGLQVSPDQAAEKTGYQVERVESWNGGTLNVVNAAPQEGSLQLSNLQPSNLQPSDPEAELRRNTLDAALAAERAELEPLAAGLYASLEALDSGDNTAFANALQALRNQLPDFAEALLPKPALADVIEQGLAAALANGWEANTQPPPPKPEPPNPDTSIAAS